MDDAEAEEEVEDDEWGTHRPSIPIPPTSTRLQQHFRRATHGVKTALLRVNDFMTIPLWAALSSIVVALLPPLQHLMIAHLSPVKGFLESAGGCSIPITLVVLGAYFNQEAPANTKEANIADEEPRNGDATGDEADERVVLTSNGTQSINGVGHLRSSNPSVTTLSESVRSAFKMRGLRRRLEWTEGRKARDSYQSVSVPGETRTVFVACMARMVVTPLIVLPCVAALAVFDANRIFDDPVFVVSNVLLISSPPALTLAQITQAASGDAFERLISRTVFWSYCILTPPLALFYVVVGLYFSRL